MKIPREPVTVIGYEPVKYHCLSIGFCRDMFEGREGAGEVDP